MDKKESAAVRTELAEERTEFSQERTEASQERTEFSAHRTAMSSERTYTSWVRTGLAGLVAGLAVLRFMHGVLADWNLRLVAAALIIYGLFCFGAAIWRYWRTGQALDRVQTHRIATTLLIVATMLLIAAGLTALWTTWIVQS